MSSDGPLVGELVPGRVHGGDGLMCGACGRIIPPETPVDDMGRPTCACGAVYSRTALMRLADAGLAPDGEAGLDPREIVARVFERPIADLEKRCDFERVIPFRMKKGKAEIDLAPHRLAVANKVTPEMLVGIIGTLIATSSSAAEAVVRIRLEVMGWRFQDTAGNVDAPPPESERR